MVKKWMRHTIYNAQNHLRVLSRRAPAPSAGAAAPPHPAAPSHLLPHALHAPRHAVRSPSCASDAHRAAAGAPTPVPTHDAHDCGPDRDSDLSGTGVDSRAGHVLASDTSHTSSHHAPAPRRTASPGARPGSLGTAPRRLVRATSGVARDVANRGGARDGTTRRGRLVPRLELGREGGARSLGIARQRLSARPGFTIHLSVRFLEECRRVCLR